ncbi:MCP four helix bundle domain-containing protein [Pectobacterium carotovorum]|uniref:methyl-accepting chemotaxis protein n=1 Tax=Pectobacterium versatile TaxID=2488639 RepID=UPI0018ED7AB8|nr:MCP four helix bundle domain-containing protein [Pectobacterium carotovorum]
MSIKFRLISVMLLMAVLLLVVSIIGLSGINSSNQSLKTMYNDRLIALGYLDNVTRQTSSVMFEIASADIANIERTKKALENISKARKVADAQWLLYSKTYLTGDEQTLEKEYDVLRKNYDENVLGAAVKSIENKDKNTLERIINASLKDDYIPLQKLMDDLIRIQSEVGNELYVSSQHDFTKILIAVVVTFLAGVVVVILLGWRLIMSIAVPVQNAVGLARKVAEGDLTHPIEVTSKDEMGQLQQAMKDMVSNLTNIVDRVHSNVDVIATASGQISSGNIDLSSRTEQQASSLEETAASMEQMTSSVKQNAINAKNANGLATTASKRAVDGGKMMTNVITTMEDIVTSAEKITNIISVIDGIAFQTNILALNAAVEAARAGEQGRGFAVVAGEVRSLAQRSASAAKEINDLIGNSVNQVTKGRSFVREAGDTMHVVVEDIQRVALLVAEISEASNEQSIGIEQINTAINQMEVVTQQNAALVNEAASAAESLFERTEELSKAVAVFRTA